MRKIDRTGERRNNINGFEMEIIEYKNNKEVKVLFTEFGIVRNTSYRKFLSGRVYPTWRNKGYESVRELEEFAHAYDEDCECDFDGEMKPTNIAVAVALGTGMSVLFLLGIVGLAIAISAIFK